MRTMNEIVSDIYRYILKFKYDGDLCIEYSGDGPHVCNITGLPKDFNAVPIQKYLDDVAHCKCAFCAFMRIR
jgi:hypothetical protein